MASSSATSEDIPSSLTISYLTGLKESDLTASAPIILTSNVVKDSDIDGESKDELLDYLRANGVTGINDATITLDHCQKATTRMQEPSFWPKHASLHPNFCRVKNWLWNHSRYRTQAKALMMEDIINANDYGTQQKTFEKFHAKILSQSEFDNTQLFKYFIIAKIGNQENLKKLKEQHKELQTVQEIKKGYAEVAEGNTTRTVDRAVKPHLETYIQELNDNLRLEEETIIQPWLQLTEEQYKEYRSGLSWWYWFMH